MWLTTYMDSQAIWRDPSVTACPTGPTGNVGGGKALPDTGQGRAERERLERTPCRKTNRKITTSAKNVPPVLL